MFKCSHKIMLFCTVLMFSDVALSDHLYSYQDAVIQLQIHARYQSQLQQIEVSQYSAQGALGLPDPTISIGLSDYPVGRGTIGGDPQANTYVGISQAIPSYASRKAVSNQHTASASQNQSIADYQLSQLKNTLIQTLTERDKVNELLRLNAARAVYLQDKSQSLNGQLESGVAVYSELVRVEAEINVLEIKNNTLESTRQEMDNQLIWLLGEVPEFNTPTISPVTEIDHIDVSTLYPVMIEQHGLEVANFEVAEKEAAFKPNFSLNAMYGAVDPNTGFTRDDMLSVGIGFSVPLWAHKNQQPRLKAAQAKYASQRYTVQDTRLQWRELMRTLLIQHQTSQQNIIELNHQYQLIDESLASLNSRYEAGSIAYTPVVDEKLALNAIEAQLMIEKARLNSLAATFNQHIKQGL